MLESSKLAYKIALLPNHTAILSNFIRSYYVKQRKVEEKVTENTKISSGISKVLRRKFQNYAALESVEVDIQGSVCKGLWSSNPIFGVLICNQIEIEQIHVQLCPIGPPSPDSNTANTGPMNSTETRLFVMRQKG